MKQRSTRIRRLVAGLAILSALALPFSLAAQERMVALDPTKTTVQFTLGDILHTVHGRFQLKQGSIVFDPSTGKASGTVVVDANSGDSGSSKRDKRMKRDILEADKYPDISFSPTEIVEGKVAPEGNSQVQLKGIFRLHGADHEIVIPIPVAIQGDQLTARMHFVIPYVAWGLKNPSTLFLRVSDKVNIDITATGHLAASAAQ
jgi:polyisoprenoid-binding protein YceI